MMDQLVIRPIGSSDSQWVDAFVAERWGASYVMAHGEQIVTGDLPGLVAERDGMPIGLLTYRVAEKALEVVTLDSLQPGQGVGTALIKAALELARAADCERAWLITTNDNLDALRFYQRSGFQLVRVDPGAVDRSRLVKPIPLIGDYGIPIRDELELEQRINL